MNPNETPYYQGIPVFPTPLATVCAGGKSLAFKPWMKNRIYWRRVEKKWAKRFGAPTRSPAIFRAKHPIYGNEVLFIHPTLVGRLIKTQFSERA